MTGSSVNDKSLGPDSFSCAVGKEEVQCFGDGERIQAWLPRLASIGAMTCNTREPTTSNESQCREQEKQEAIVTR